MKKKDGQKYQNSYSYKPSEKLQEISKKIDYRCLCARCREQIQWKVQFNKYKALTELAKWYSYFKNSQKCTLRTITMAYRHLCQICAKSNKICSKCLGPLGESQHDLDPKVITKESEPKKANKVDPALLKEMEKNLSTMKERSKRKIIRLIQEKKITWSANGEFIYVHDGSKIEGIVYKSKGSMSDDEFEDIDEDMDHEDDKEKEDNRDLDELD